MSMLQIFEKKCLVVKLLHLGRYQVELCIFKPKCTIGWHKHEQQDIEVMHLWGNAIYGVNYEVHPTSSPKYLTVGLRHIFRCYSVRAGVKHGAEIGRWGLITLSIQRWKTNCKQVTTVTQDFIYAK